CFCESIADTTRNPDPFAKQEALMKLGAQGPNPFFYYNFWPWLKNNPLKWIGTLMHTEKCGPFLMDLIESAKSKRKEIRAYVFGFVTHHILDRHIHPFIHYHAGYDEAKHHKLEINIDTLIMKKYHNLETWKIPVYKEIDVGFTLDKDIAKLLHQTIKKHFPEVSYSTPKYIQKAYKHMKLALKILADPYGWKNALLGQIISPYCYRPLEKDVDYLNTNKKVWHHSATNEKLTESFDELYKQAKMIGTEIMNELLAYWYQGSEEAKERLRNLIGNISYDTGMAVNLKLENKYSNPII
ncbi:MAG TPA: zinc dependent phospholipase C family protein, partial [Virgibacillus sp.]